MDLRALSSALSQIAEEKGIKVDQVLEAIEMAIAAAYKKDYGERGQIVRAKFDPETGKMEVWQVKIVVDETMIKTEEEIEAARQAALESGEAYQPEEEEVFTKEGEEAVPHKIRFNPEKHIMIEEAKQIDPNVELGQEMIFPLETREDFGRVAAQTAKQVVIQRIREAERESIYTEFESKTDQIISGVVQRMEGPYVFVDIGKTIGIVLPKDQVARERYRIGERMRFYVLGIESGPKGPQVYLSRSHPKFVARLFELEVPEISGGSVEIKAIAREAGDRTKIAVASLEDGVDPIGSCVGQRGTRVAAVIHELGGEKIDIIEWKSEPAAFISAALSPAKVLDVKLENGRALVTVVEDQLSLAIGREGQNVRLAAKLTNSKIDIKSKETGEIKGSTETAEEDAPVETEGKPEEKIEEAEDVKEETNMSEKNEEK
ncbi:MAG: transcription termination/antitermination protein NusA [Candidatus Spechtbacteria bacterium]|nr:transcription termination/antitermination protein NusA [Candidatus Spechtbacteria bacterium]